jgi:branched-chain amino acid transport system substrate-binding protein
MQSPSIKREETAMKITRIKAAREILFTILLVCLLSLLVNFIGVRSYAAEPIKVGAVVSLTGWAGFIGTPQKEAFIAIFDDINARGGIGGRKIEYYLEDD